MLTGSKTFLSSLALILIMAVVVIAITGNPARATDTVPVYSNTSGFWADSNPTIPANIIILESNTGKMKLGDGNTPWASLGYINSVPNGSGVLTVPSGGTGAATLTGLVKGNGTAALSSAASGTDYLAPGSLTSTCTGSHVTLSIVKGLVTAATCT